MSRRCSRLASDHISLSCHILNHHSNISGSLVQLMASAIKPMDSFTARTNSRGLDGSKGFRPESIATLWFIFKGCIALVSLLLVRIT